MEDVAEVVLVRFSDSQNKSLKDSLKAHYRLVDAPDVEKSIYVAKDSYQAHLRAKLRARTPFESDRPFSSFEFDAAKLPFSVVHSKILFKFPSDRTITLIEYLTEPNGLTKSVELSDSGGTSLTFDKYYHAEAEVVSRYLAEKGQIT